MHNRYRAPIVISVLLPKEVVASSVDEFSQFSDGIEERVVVGSLDLNQCRWLPDEIAGTKPEVFDVANNAELCLKMDDSEKLKSLSCYRGLVWILRGHT